MKKTWSISTTVRNPERVLPFLHVLKNIEGEIFNENTQRKFQILLIQNRLYNPLGLSDQMAKYYETLKDKMTSTQAEEIFEHMVLRSKENSIGAWAFLIGVVLAVFIGLSTSSLLSFSSIQDYSPQIYAILSYLIIYNPRKTIIYIALLFYRNKILTHGK